MPSCYSPTAALLKNSSIRLDDYADVMELATFRCAKETTAHVSVTLTLRPSANATVAQAGQHLFDRLQHKGVWGNMTPSVVFGHDLLSNHSDFSAGSTCGEHITLAQPWFSVSGADISGDRINLQLARSGLADLFHFSTFDFEWDPRPDAAARRLGADGVAHDSRRLSMDRDYALVNGLNINYNPATGAAAVDPITMGPIRCENCFAHYEVTLKARLRFCVLAAGGTSWSGTTYWAWDSTYAPSATTLSGTYAARPYDGGYQANGSPWTASALPPDCVSLGVAAPWSADAAVDIDAWVEGSAAFNLKVASDGWSTSGASAGCVGDDVSNEAACKPIQLLPNVKLPAISLAAAGVPVSIVVSVGLQGSVVYSGAVTGRLQFGASASTGTAKLGGNLRYTYNTRAQLTPYLNFPSPSYGVLPTVVRVDSFTGRVSALLRPTINISAWDVFPVVTQTRSLLRMDVVTGALVRRLREHHNSSRQLQGASAATCPATGGVFAASAQTVISTNFGAVTGSDLAAALRPFSPAVASGLERMYPNEVIAASAPTVSTLAPITLGAACLVANVEYGATPTPSSAAAVSPSRSAAATPAGSVSASASVAASVAGGAVSASRTPLSSTSALPSLVGPATSTPTATPPPVLPPCTTRSDLDSMAPNPGVRCFFGQRRIEAPPSDVSALVLSVTNPYDQSTSEYCVAYDFGAGSAVRTFAGMRQQQLLSMITSASYDNWMVCNIDGCNRQLCETATPSGGAQSAAIPLNVVIGVAAGAGALVLVLIALLAVSVAYIRKHRSAWAVHATVVPPGAAAVDDGGVVTPKRMPPVSTRRLATFTDDPTVPPGWVKKPDDTFISPNGHDHRELPAALKELCKGLPPGWEVDFDDGDAYYIDTNAGGATQWERPAAGAGMIVNPMRRR